MISTVFCVLISVCTAVIAWCFLMLYRNKLVFEYRMKYLKDFGCDRFDTDLPSYDTMLNAHIKWGIVKLIRYIKGGKL